MLLSIIVSFGIGYYYRDYFYNKYLDVVDGYIKIKCCYDKCNKMHKYTHQEYLEMIKSDNLNVFCQECLEKAFDEFIKMEKSKYNNK
jgi:hypothetical protein